MTPIPDDFSLASYRYDLPPDRIAQEPAQRRDGSKLLVLDRTWTKNTVRRFADLADELPKDALLVANNSRVLPARLYGAKTTGGRVQFLLLTPLPLIAPQPCDDGFEAEAMGLLRASKAPRKGEVVAFDADLRLTVLERGEFGRCRVRLFWRGDLAALFQRLGHMPLPPYIARPDAPEDQERYQTTYADPAKTGSVAAPTAGLHFTPELRQDLRNAGFGWAEVTLYVGYGTFSPVRAMDIREHRMHAEWVEVPEATARAVQEAKEQGRPVVAVGTTSARSLEGMHKALGRVGAFCGETDIFIMPGCRFAVVDALLTNFHLPESSLLIMVSALAGRKRILDAYAQALASGFRFFSYGDAMLIR